MEKEKITLPLVRLKKSVEKPDVFIIYDVDENMYIATKKSVIYDMSTVTFELAANGKR